MRFFRVHHIFIPLLALLATMPLLIHGCSCGHDQPFHMQSWLDAAQQFRHGTIYPRWAYSPAWQAGEPRFVFYPPLSWFLGALLTTLFPMNAVPVVFTWIALTGAGFSMHYLASRFTSSGAALLCAAVYLANPYMLFNAFERGAYAELLAATWMPLVLLSALRRKPTIAGTAIPLGLVWLTNAPAGVMATYTLVLLGVVRIVLTLRHRAVKGRGRVRATLPLLYSLGGGMVLGLALVSFYLLPAAYERRYVQVAMAIIPNLRYQDNFLFGKTDYAAHNTITFAVSVLALVLLAAAIVVVALGFRFQSTWVSEPGPKEFFSRGVSQQLLVLVIVVGLLLTPASSFLWEHLPNLKYLQFPWRLLSVLSVILAFALIPVTSKLQRSRALGWTSAAIVVVAMSQLGSYLYRQGCEANEYPSFQAAAFTAGHGVLPTDEYTPGDADNDVQRTDNPGYWLVQGDPNQPAPGTLANPNETITNYDGPIPFENTISMRAPKQIKLSLQAPTILVLNLREFPAWHVFRNGSPWSEREHRDDGLLAVPLPSGDSVINIRWQRSWDQNVGFVITAFALLALGTLLARSRKIKA